MDQPISGRVPGHKLDSGVSVLASRYAGNHYLLTLIL